MSSWRSSFQIKAACKSSHLNALLAVHHHPCNKPVVIYTYIGCVLLLYQLRPRRWVSFTNQIERIDATKSSNNSRMVGNLETLRGRWFVPPVLTYNREEFHVTRKNSLWIGIEPRTHVPVAVSLSQKHSRLESIQNNHALMYYKQLHGLWQEECSTAILEFLFEVQLWL